MTFQQLLGLVVVGGLLYIGGQYVASQPQRVEQEIEANREITVSGQGKVSARPDVAQVMLGVTTGPQSTAERAMGILTQRFNTALAAVKAEGVEEDDIQTTNLSVNPVYDYQSGQQTLRGFEASESIQIKIRDMDKIGTVISRATSEGINQAGGIQFVIDEPEELEREAIASAIADAKKNAEALADELGVNLGRVKSFSASGTPPTPPLFYAANEMKAADARGGDIQVPSGTNEISASVSITYELK
jgi:uncharacterized protein YggE